MTINEKSSKMPFKILERKKGKAQYFDKDNIFIEQAGQKINMYDMIQANREDTEIYAIMDKYGTQQPLENEYVKGKLGVDTEKVYGEFQNINLMDAQNALIATENIWKQLPLEIRNEFGNSKTEFLARGMKWAEEKENIRKAELEKQKKYEETLKKSNEKGEVNNG